MAHIVDAIDQQFTTRVGDHAQISDELHAQIAKDSTMPWQRPVGENCRAFNFESLDFEAQD